MFAVLGNALASLAPNLRHMLSVARNRQAAFAGNFLAGLGVHGCGPASATSSALERMNLCAFMFGAFAFMLAFLLACLGSLTLLLALWALGLLLRLLTVSLFAALKPVFFLLGGV
jgi:hypothetical protein